MVRTHAVLDYDREAAGQLAYETFTGNRRAWSTLSEVSRLNWIAVADAVVAEATRKPLR
jgi:hypothetical protein